MTHPFLGGRSRTENRQTLFLAALPRGGALTSGFLTICFLLLAGCVGPVNQREAESLASRSLRKFCAASPCGAPRLVKTERLKDRWMVDFDAPNGLYTVAVDRSGNTNVTAWDKNSPK